MRPGGAAGAYAQALAVLEEISKATTRHTSTSRLRLEGADFRRDPGSGRFRSKVKHTRPSRCQAAKQPGSDAIGRPRPGRKLNSRAAGPVPGRVPAAGRLPGRGERDHGAAGRPVDVIYHLRGPGRATSSPQVALRRRRRRRRSLDDPDTRAGGDRGQARRPDRRRCCVRAGRRRWAASDGRRTGSSSDQRRRPGDQPGFARPVD